VGGKKRAPLRSGFENLKGRNCMRNLDVDDRIILDSLLKKCGKTVVLMEMTEVKIQRRKIYELI
jgi:hypothetical protein